MIRRVFFIAIILAFYAAASFSQTFPEKEILKKLNASKIEMDEGNEDGVFKVYSKASKKWGMYQWMYEGTNVNELIPMKYDSLSYFPFNGNFTAVYNNGKVGFYLSAWSYYDNAKQSVPCLYDEFQRYNNKGVTYLAVSKNGKWGWVDWLTGEEKTAFSYETKDDLPYPLYEQKYFFE